MPEVGELGRRRVEELVKPVQGCLQVKVLQEDVSAGPRRDVFGEPQEKRGCLHSTDHGQR